MAAALLAACAGAHRESRRVVDASEYTSPDGVKTSSKGNPAPKGKMVCQYEESVGSHLPERVCRYQAAPGENVASGSSLESGAGGPQPSGPPAAPERNPASPGPGRMGGRPAII